MHKRMKALLSLLLVVAMVVTMAVPVCADGTSLDEATYDLDNELPVIPIQLVSDIVVSTKPSKTNYLVGDDLVLDGGQITVIYDDGTTSDPINITSDMVSGYNKDQVGSQDLLVTYEGKTTTLRVIVGKGFYGRSLMFKDALYINAYVYVPSDELGNCSVKYTHVRHLASGDETETAEILLNDMKKNGSYRYVEIPIAIKEIGDDITVDLCENGEVVESKIYSAKGYCEQQIEDKTNSQDFTDLMKCLLDYGTFMQQYKGYNVDSLANANYSFGKDHYTSITIDNIYEKSINGGESIEGITYSGRAVVLDTKVHLNAYFSLGTDENISDYKFTNKVKVDEEEKEIELTPKKNGSYYYVELEGFPAKNVDEVRELTVTKTGSEGKITVRLCILEYAYEWQNDSEDEYFGLTMKALYEYYRLSKAYLTNTNK